VNANKVVGLPLRDDVIKTVMAIFVSTVGFIDPKDVFPTTQPARDFQIDTDDLTVFAMEVVKHFGIKPAPSEWHRDAGTMEDIADLVLRHLGKRNSATTSQR
jgi:acyl carrier protein